MKAARQPRPPPLLVGDCRSQPLELRLVGPDPLLQAFQRPPRVGGLGDRRIGRFDILHEGVALGPQAGDRRLEPRALLIKAPDIAGQGRAALRQGSHLAVELGRQALPAVQLDRRMAHISRSADADDDQDPEQRQRQDQAASGPGAPPFGMARLGIPR